MALNINGTTGISGVDGSASAPAVTGTDSNTGINFASDTVNINTGGSTKATVDSNGRLGIGTTSPAQKLDVTSTNNIAYALDGWSLAGKGDSSDILFGGISGSQFDTLKFYTSGSEHMRIDSSGKVGINVTAPDKILEVNNTGITNHSPCLIHASGSDNVRVVGLRSSRASGGTSAHMIEFFDSSGTKVGNIDSNGSSTSYNTSSDYRLKENVVGISDGITRLKTLKPYRFNFKSNATATVDGFLAHEVTAVPEAVTGTKDQVATADDVNDEIKEGDPIYQGIDQSKLVPLLTAALQEAITKIETLETKVAALETA